MGTGMEGLHMKVAGLIIGFYWPYLLILQISLADLLFMFDYCY